MKFLYWNTNKIKSLNSIIDICKSEKPDIFFLSEIDEEILNKNGNLLKEIGFEYSPNPGCERVKVIKNERLDIELGLQNKYFSIIDIPKACLSVISVHLPSQMFQHMDALKKFIRDFREQVDHNVGSPLDEKIIVIGDFNVNPFDKAMIDFDGFSATNSIMSRRKLTHLGNLRELYYNPTWQLYSSNEFPGTKYFRRPSGSSYDVLEHHFLDQVVISVKLRDEISKETIKVIDKSSKYIFNKKGSNDINESDHLPLSYQIKF